MKTRYSHSTTLRVRYGETDQMGYCYYGNYAQYFEVGRVETLRNLGMSYRSMEEQGIMLPVAHFSVDYHAPAKYDDELTIVTHIKEISGVKIIFDYEILNQIGQSIATATTTLVFVDKVTMRPTRIPAEFQSLFNNFRSDE